MNLKFNLPKRQSELLALGEGETIRYCSPYDIDTNGHWMNNGYIVVTDRRLVVLTDQAVSEQIPIKDIAFLKCESLVNNGILVARNEGDTEDRIIARFSMKHVSRVAFVAKGALLIKEGSKKEAVSRESLRDTGQAA